MNISDILESYPRSPFLATDNENFLDPREREHQGEGLAWLSFVSLLRIADFDL